MIFYLLLILVIVASLTASITSFLSAREEIKFKIYDNAPATTAQTPANLELAVATNSPGSFVMQAGSTSEIYSKNKLYIDTATDENGAPTQVQFLGRLDPELGEFELMNKMIKDPQYLAYITYTPSLDAFMTQEEAKAREFRRQNPDKQSDKRANSEFCNQKWYVRFDQT
jgi:hypothetical protein